MTSARTAYLAEDVCRHLATLCRLYNDLGSAACDADEGAGNSLKFPEFFFREVALNGGSQQPGTISCGSLSMSGRD